MVFRWDGETKKGLWFWLVALVFFSAGASDFLQLLMAVISFGKSKLNYIIYWVMMHGMYDSIEYNLLYFIRSNGNTSSAFFRLVCLWTIGSVGSSEGGTSMGGMTLWNYTTKLKWNPIWIQLAKLYNGTNEQKITHSWQLFVGDPKKNQS